MGLWSKLFGKADGAKDSEPPASSPAQAEPAQPLEPPSFGDACQEVLDYLRELRSGGSPQQDFERESLANDLGFDTLDLAELIAAHAAQQGRSAKDVAGRMRGGVRIPGAEDYDDDHGGKSSLANLVERAGILMEAFPKAVERRTLLTSGAVGPGNEVRPFSPQVTVGFLLKYLRSLGL